MANRDAQKKMKTGDKAQQAKKLRLAERRLLCFQLYKSGKTYRAISKLLEVEHDIKISHFTVMADVKHILGKLNDEAMSEAKEYRRIQLERIQEIIGAIWPKVIGIKIIEEEDGSTREEKVSNHDQLEACRTMVKLMEREAKLVGADAPNKIDIEHRIRELAIENDLDPDDAVREAERQVRAVASERGK